MGVPPRGGEQYKTPLVSLSGRSVSTTPRCAKPYHVNKSIFLSHSNYNTKITMASQDDHDTLPEETAGFKVGEKKTLNEIQNMGKWFHLGRL